MESSERLIQRVRHCLISQVGKTVKEVDDFTLYQALSRALREEIMVNWTAAKVTFERQDRRMLYYFSMEYLPGRILGNNMTNIQAGELVKAVVAGLGRDYSQVVQQEPDPGLGNGGLGRLASCFMDSLATLHLPGMGYGLRYQYGIFEQQLWEGVQVETTDQWLLRQHPWELRQDNHQVAVKFGGLPVTSSEGHREVDDYEEVQAIPYDLPIVGYGSDSDYSVLTLRLWTTKESPTNFKLQRFNAGRLGQASENTALCDVLYPDDSHDTGKRLRLKQEFLLVSASLQDIISRYLHKHKTFDQFADKVRIQINDTHPALVIPELIRLLTKRHGLSLDLAIEITQTCTSYTNHTILTEALEQWDHGLFACLLPRQLEIIETLNERLCQAIRAKYPNDEDKVRRMSILENGKVRMAPLSFYGAHKVNGVAALHTEILKATTLSDFHEMYPDRLVNVTNGITQRRWLLHCNPELSRFITARIGDGWITNFEEIRQLSSFANDEPTLREFLAIKQRNKEKLFSRLCQTPARNSHGIAEGPAPTLNTRALLDVQVKRIHEYKRQLLNALHLIILYHDLKRGSDNRLIDRVVLISGKAAPGYKAAKDIIRLLHCIARTVNGDPDIGSRLKVVYMENYSVSNAELIIPAADLSEQISTAGMEASGTGNMKLAVNGALTIGTQDGANVEMEQEVGEQWWPFTFGCTADEIQHYREAGTYAPIDILSHHSEIREAVDALRNKTFTLEDAEHETLLSIYRSLTEEQHGQPADNYFVLKDLAAYTETQRQVEALYHNPLKWAEYALHNIAGMGKFSSDTSIRGYSERIWGLTPTPPDPAIIAEVQEIYSEHDRCHIAPTGLAPTS